MKYKHRRNKKSIRLLNLFLSLFIRTHKSKNKLDLANKKSIIIVFPHLLGDIVMFTTFLRVLRRCAPHAEISLVAPKWAKEILSSQNLVDEFYDFGNTNGILGGKAALKNRKEILKTLNLIRNKKFEVAIEPFGNVWAAIFTRFIKADRYVGMSFEGLSYLFSDVYEYPRGKHLVDIMLSLAKNMGCEMDKNDIYPYIELTASDKTKNREFKFANNLNGNIVIGIHPGASVESRRWEYYGELIEKLSNTFSNIKFLIFEGPSEKNVVDLLEDIIKSKTNVNYLRIKEKLSDYIRILDVCDYIICNDSSCGHFSAALKVPVTVIFGQGDPEFIAPRSSSLVNCISKNFHCKPCNQTICPLGTLECIKWISTDVVFNSVKKDINQLIKIKEYEGSLT